jgi:hypothetical protein
MSSPSGPATHAYTLVPATSVDDTRLAAFAAAVWPDSSPQRFLSSWWRRADSSCAVVALERSSGVMAGICAGRPGEWMIGGQRYPAVAIGDWYVAPGHGGRLIGRRLIRQFYAPDRLLYGFSLSEDAIAYVSRLGWTSPHTVTFMALPLPSIAGLVSAMVVRQSEILIEEHVVSASAFPPAIARDLDQVEAASANNATARMYRGSSEWSWRLSMNSERQYHFGVARRAGRPVGYVVVRRLTPGSSRLLGRLPAALVTDLVAVDGDVAVLRALVARAARIAGSLGAVVALAVTNNTNLRRALAMAGFLSPSVPFLGRKLQRHAPQFVWLPRGPGAGLAAERMELMFGDSDVDLKL